MKINKGETYGSFIKRIRLKAKLTQADLAARLGFSVGTVSAWERGANVPIYSQKIVDEFAKRIK